MHTASHDSQGSRLRFLIAEGRAALTEASLLHVVIGGWKGARNISKKQLRGFLTDLKPLRLAGFTWNPPRAQIVPKDLDKLQAIIKKHGLRSDGVSKAPFGISFPDLAGDPDLYGK